MTTQVSTSHTLQSRAPLVVPKRPARPDVTLAIQKILPYAVVFLLALMVYTSFTNKSSVSYPPYSPPNMGTDSYKMMDFVKDQINERTRRLEDLQKRSQDVGVATGRWVSWKLMKEAELKEKLETARSQQLKNSIQENTGAGRMAADMADSMSNLRASMQESVDTESETDVERMLHETRDMAYDAYYSWKQAAGATNNTASSIPLVRPATAATTEALKTFPVPPTKNTMIASKLGSLVERVKLGMMEDEDVRREVAMQEGWAKIDFDQKTELIVHQLQLLGDDVVEAVVRRLGLCENVCNKN